MAANGNIAVKSEESSLRPILCELGLLTRPDGSALLTQGNTAVMAAVYGPTEVRMQRLRVDQATVEAIFRPKSGVPCTADRMRESLLRETCETAMLSALYPRTSVTIILQEMQDSGGLLACAINSSCLALMNSGLAMKFLYAAVSCSILEDDSIILDPEGAQIKDAKAHLTFAFDSISKNVIASYTSGTFSRQKYSEGLSRCQQASDFLFDFYRDIVRKYASTL